MHRDVAERRDQDANHTPELLQLQARLEHARRELQAASDEVRAANEAMKATCAELQSAREEMETMNEELQASNQEMETLRSELRHRTEQLDRTDAFLTSILRNLRVGVAVVDPDLRVTTWNEPTDDMWGVRPDEAQGRPFLMLDIGLPRAGLETPMRECLARRVPKHEFVVEAVDRRGRPFRCRLMMSPLIDADGQCGGVIVLMEHWSSMRDEAGGGA